MISSITNQAVKSNLKAFSIIGLFRTRNVSLKFNKPINVLLGENGLGKTTTLNALYYTLTCNFVKLNAITFDRIVLEFWNAKSIEINKLDLELSIYNQRSFSSRKDEQDMIDIIERKLSANDRNQLFKITVKRNKNVSDNTFIKEIKSFCDKISESYDLASEFLFRGIITLFNIKIKTVNVESIRNQIKHQLSEQIIYFPTYRRIEEELHNLGNNRVELEGRNKLLIQFGMDDVKDILDEVLLRIKNSSINGFSKITGSMLEQYVEGINDLSGDIIEKINPDVLRIILERIGENISQDYKHRIIDLVSSKEIFETQEHYRYLINFLSKLIAVYEEQSKDDNSIKRFAAVCNKYLYGKRLYYNESKVQLTVVQLKDGTDIEFKSLSSGEKQIISLFAKLYFEADKETIILFDEPELSLSIEWQRMLLPDVLAANKCNLLLTVTHSPFVFDNELDELAEDMSKYVIER